MLWSGKLAKHDLYWQMIATPGYPWVKHDGVEGNMWTGNLFADTICPCRNAKEPEVDQY